MNWYFTFSVFFAIYFSFVKAAATPAVLPPSQDEFYTAPDNFESAKNGEILRFRVAPAHVRSIYFTMNVKNAYQLLYRTTDSVGKPSYAASILLEPYNANNSRILQYSVAEDSSSVDCSVSYALIKGASMSPIITQAEVALMQLGLNEGWWLHSSDYEGPDAAFTAGRMAAHANLDSIRAVLASGNKTNILPNADVALWGYSGGAFASGWTASLQPSYAPELAKNLVGCAFGGVPANWTTLYAVVDGTLYNGLTVSGLYGLGAAYPKVRTLFESLIPNRMKYIMHKARDACCVPANVYTAYIHMFDGPKRIIAEGWDFFNREEVLEAVNHSTLGYNLTEMPEIPLFLYHGIPDNIVPVENIQKLYSDWCANGIESFEVAYSEKCHHITEAVDGAPAAFTWIKSRFEHKEPVKGCKKSTHSLNMMYPGVTTATLRLFGGLIKTLYGGELGPSASSGSSNTSKRAEDFTFTFELDKIALTFIEQEHQKFKRDIYVD